MKFQKIFLCKSACVIFSFIFFLLFSCFSRISLAENEGFLNKLLAPGPLMMGHKHLEGKDCLKCHEAGKGISVTKCLDCHKEIKKHVDSGKGFHGINLTGNTCIKCHSDHKGRFKDSTQVDESSFDHAKQTGYPLDGKHSNLKCTDCHNEVRQNKKTRPNETRFFGKTSSCVGCHKKDDVHFFAGQYSQKDCNACHDTFSWKEKIKFNHNKDTKFKLIGRHVDLKCNDCHQADKKKTKKMKYSWPSLNQAQCLSCHQDFHRKKLSHKFSGGECTKCHSQNSWKIEVFRHEVTKFKLNGKHAEINCVDCHKQKKNFVRSEKLEVKNFDFTGLKTQCLSCHKDFHRFSGYKSPRMGDLGQCLKCHTEQTWNKIVNFDHNTGTRFKIEGEHLSLECAACHLPNPKGLKTSSKNLFSVKTPTYHWTQFESKTCETCHRSPHVGQFSQKMLQQKCSSCHVAEGWKSQKVDSGFDHGKTRFALTGAHKQTRCSDCHGLSSGKQIFKFKNFQSQFCIDCHSNIHVNQFSPKFSSQSCVSCHNTESFSKLSEFDHGKTNYPLLGEHSKLNCNDCHRPTNTALQIKWPNFKSKDHGPIKLVKKSKFLFPELKQQKCLSCHQDFHLGQLSSNCLDCHTEKGWKPSSFNHNVQSRFKLLGSHEKVECLNCHLPSKKVVVYKNENRFSIQYKPLKSNCVDCHSDFHRGQLSLKCQECHTERAWKPAQFIHNKQSEFKLRDKHEKVECVKCHINTKEVVQFKNELHKVVKYKPISAACIGCHKDPHRGSFGKNCQECHTEKSWNTTKDFHKNFTLTGVHYTLDCAECHKENRKLSGLSQQCLACHQRDDVHNGMLPNCKQCHTQHFWEASQFRHSLTRFPLRGAHRTLDCFECHKNGIYKGLSSACLTCHLSDFQAFPAPHSSGNTNCIQCHKNTFSFKN